MNVAPTGSSKGQGLTPLAPLVYVSYVNLRRPSSRPLDLQDVIYNIVGGMILLMVGIAGFVILAVILEALARLAHL